MNITNDYTNNSQVSSGYEYSTYILGGLFIISEVLPLLKSRSNGFLQGLLCLIKGSKCMTQQLESAVVKVIKENNKV